MVDLLAVKIIFILSSIFLNQVFKQHKVCHYYIYVLNKLISVRY